MTSPRKILDYEMFTDEQCEKIKERLRSRKSEAAYILEKAQQTYKDVCEDYEIKMLAIAESRKKPDTEKGSRLIKKMKEEPLPRHNSNHRGMD